MNRQWRRMARFHPKRIPVRFVYVRDVHENLHPTVALGDCDCYLEVAKDGSSARLKNDALPTWSVPNSLLATNR